MMARIGDKYMNTPDLKQLMLEYRNDKDGPVKLYNKMKECEMSAKEAQEKGEDPSAHLKSKSIYEDAMRRVKNNLRKQRRQKTTPKPMPEPKSELDLAAYGLLLSFLKRPNGEEEFLSMFRKYRNKMSHNKKHNIEDPNLKQQFRIYKKAKALLGEFKRFGDKYGQI